MRNNIFFVLYETVDQNKMHSLDTIRSDRVLTYMNSIAHNMFIKKCIKSKQLIRKSDPI